MAYSLDPSKFLLLDSLYRDIYNPLCESGSHDRLRIIQTTLFLRNKNQNIRVMELKQTNQVNEFLTIKRMHHLLCICSLRKQISLQMWQIMIFLQSCQGIFCNHLTAAGTRYPPLLTSGMRWSSMSGGKFKTFFFTFLSAGNHKGLPSIPYDGTPEIHWLIMAIYRNDESSHSYCPTLGQGLYSYSHEESMGERQFAPTKDIFILRGAAKQHDCLVRK